MVFKSTLLVVGGMAALMGGCFKRTGGSSAQSLGTPGGGTPTGAPASSSATTGALPAQEAGLLRAEIQLLRDKIDKSDTELAAELRAQLQQMRDNYQELLKKTQEQLQLEGQNRQELENKLAQVDARLTKADSELAAQLRQELAAKAQELALQVAQLSGQLTGLQAQVTAMPSLYVTKAELRDQMALTVKLLQDVLNTRVSQLEALLSQDLKTFQAETLAKFQQVDARQATMAADIQSQSQKLKDLSDKVTQGLTELSIKADKAADDAHKALTRLNALELDGKNLVNEVGALLSTIQADIGAAQAGGQTPTTTDGSGLTQTAQALNLLMSGFTKEAAGLVVFSQKVDEALKTRIDALQSNYSNLLARMASAEQKTSQVQSQLDEARTELQDLQTSYLAYQNNQAAVQKKLMDDVALLTAQLQTLQNKVEAVPNPAPAPTPAPTPAPENP